MTLARRIGRSELAVQPIGLGGMPMSIAGRPDEARSMATIGAALDAGIDFIDTADVYCLDEHDIGHNERLIAKALRAVDPGRHVVVATKGGLVRPDGRWERDASPQHLKSACARSLAALGVEQIDLYQLHAPDDRVALADSVGALAELRAAGAIAHVGLSNVSVAQIREAAAIVPIVSVQNRCNPYDLRAFRDGVVAYCEQEEIAFLPYSPVGGGRGVAALRDDPVLTQVASRHQATAPQIALAWLLAKSPVMIPIPGASRPESARSSAAAAQIALTAVDLAELDAAFDA